MKHCETCTCSQESIRNALEKHYDVCKGCVICGVYSDLLYNELIKEK